MRSSELFLGQTLLHLFPEQLVLQRVLFLSGSFIGYLLDLFLDFLNVRLGPLVVLALGEARGGAAGGGGGGGGGGLGDHETQVSGWRS